MLWRNQWSLPWPFPLWTSLFCLLVLWLNKNLSTQGLRGVGQGCGYEKYKVLETGELQGNVSLIKSQPKSKTDSCFFLFSLQIQPRGKWHWFQVPTLVLILVQWWVHGSEALGSHLFPLLESPAMLRSCFIDSGT